MIPLDVLPPRTFNKRTGRDFMDLKELPLAFLTWTHAVSTHEASVRHDEVIRYNYTRTEFVIILISAAESSHTDAQ